MYTEPGNGRSIASVHLCGMSSASARNSANININKQPNKIPVVLVNQFFGGRGAGKSKTKRLMLSAAAGTASSSTGDAYASAAWSIAVGNFDLTSIWRPSGDSVRHGDRDGGWESGVGSRESSASTVVKDVF